ncbi:hypothetical protein BDQ17DRAFT_1433919 [Cyathus striatus]|nr:hypothetical protein BDQ17DRAFT_1433919 [Cyathus striatus]
MKKLFGHSKQKAGKPATPSKDQSLEDQQFATPIHQMHATYTNISHPSPQPRPQLQSQSVPSRDSRVIKSSEDDRGWEVVQTHPDHLPALSQLPSVAAPTRTSSLVSLPPGASPPLPSPVGPPSSLPPRAASPYSSAISNASSTKLDRDRDTTRKRTQPTAPVALGILSALDSTRSHVPMLHHNHSHSEERDDESQAELTRMIGYLTATASEDWTLVLEVCDRASANESNAKEAVRALRREFKFGEPSAQLSAARLWAIMLRNSSDLFIAQSTSRKFLDTLEDLLTSSRTSPVVRERLLDVVAAAAYASGTKKDGKAERDGFRGLWRRVKPLDKPDEGMPIDNDDAMFNPPVSSQAAHYDVPVVAFQEPSPVPADTTPPLPSNPPRKRKSPTRNRIIPPEEDMRRLFQECTIGGHFQEFYAKCRSSQELIYAQISWASAIAERSRQIKAAEGQIEQTTEEKLLDALLAANEELVSALNQYDDLKRVAMERKAEDRSRKEIRMDSRNLQYIEGQENGLSVHSSGYVGGSSSRSPSPSSYSPPTVFAQPLPRHASQHSSELNLHSQSLAPPPSAPHGPRSPAQISLHTRTPPPGTPVVDSPATQSNMYSIMNGVQRLDLQNRISQIYDDATSTDEEEYQLPAQPSAKALGKQKAAEPDESEVFDPNDIYYNNKSHRSFDDLVDSDQESSNEGRWHPLAPPVHYVYDAAAERTQQRIREGHALVNGVH